jgi:hypothetical protein
MAWKLVDGYLKGDAASKIIDSYDFYIIPIVNPDGTPIFSPFSLSGSTFSDAFDI